MEIREYKKEDLPKIYSLMKEFQDYLVTIDSLKQIIPFVDGGKEYTDLCLEQVKNEDGKIFVAVDGNEVIGFTAGVVEPSDRRDIINEGKSKFGRIIELFLAENKRKSGMGKNLISKIEEYLKGKGCQVIRLEVLTSNKNAYEVYKHLGYIDRTIDLIKIIK